MMASRGYDMTPTMYSPDGRIYQVEYAIETVNRGTLAIGIKFNEGVIVAVEEVPQTLQTSSRKRYSKWTSQALPRQDTFLMHASR